MLTLSHMKTWKPSQGRDKNLREPLEDLEARSLPKSLRLQQHFIKSRKDKDITFKYEVQTPKSF